MLRAILNINPLILATSLALLAIALALLVRRRIALARLRRKRLADQAAAADGGETSALPLAHLASAVEVLDLDDLLAGEEGSVAAAARRQLEEPTNVSTAPDTLFPLPPMPAARSAAAAAPPLTLPASAVALADPHVHCPRGRPRCGRGRPDRARARARLGLVRGARLPAFQRLAGSPTDRAGAAAPAGPGPCLCIHRGAGTDYARAGSGTGRPRPIDRPDTDPGGGRNGVDPATRKRFRREGVRLVDQNEMRREFEKLDLRVAAKIIAVARSRARLRKEAP